MKITVTNNSLPLIYTTEFLRVNANDVLNELNLKGYYAFPSAIHPSALAKIEEDSTRNRINMNANVIGGVYTDHGQYYHTNLLSVSKTFYDFSTSPFVFQICQKYLGDKFRLKALRYYETYAGHQMQWHTDNKTDKAFAHIPGIIFIFYISDVYDGEFQYVEGSHVWSGEKAYSDYSDEFIETNYGSQVKSFKMPRGSLVIYNTYGIHRAKPIETKQFIRKSVFFQVDNELERSEPIIVNTEYITEMNETIAMYLGFGKPGGYDVFPATSLTSLRLDQQVAALFMNYFYQRSRKKIFSYFPKNLKAMVKKIIRRGSISVRS
jgi:hypothetical protein